MAVTTLTDRDISVFLKASSTNENIGPGSYEPSTRFNQFKPKNHTIKLAPFGSNSGMNTTAPDSYIKSNYSPGPGFYDIHSLKSTVNQHFNQDKNEGMLYMLRNGVMQRKAQWHSVERKGNKLDTINKTTTVESNIGPGSYDPHGGKSSFEQQKVKRFKKSQIGKTSFSYLMNKSALKFTSVPSIPSNIQLVSIQKQTVQDVSLNETSNDTFQNQKKDNPFVQQESTENSFIIAKVNIQNNKTSLSNIGPGAYNPQQIQKHSPSSIWAKSKMERKLWFEAKNNAKQNLTHTQADIEKLQDDETLLQIEDKQREMKQKRIAKLFKNQYKQGQQSIQQRNLGNEDEDSSTDQDDDYFSQKITPGPGQYIDIEKYSSIRKQHKDLKHQYFGSTEKRFKGSEFANDNRHKGTSPSLGPGAYNIKNTFHSIASRKVISPQPHEIKRVFDLNKDEVSKPGPGNYDINTEVLIRKKDFQKPSQQAFGSSDTRKITQIDETTPGPGDYIQENIKQKNKISTSNFKSNTKRVLDKYLVNDPTIPSAADYNLQYFKATSYHELQGGAPNNILVLKRAVQKQNERQHQKDDSSEKIIAQRRSLDNYRNLGPGTYSPSHHETFFKTTKYDSNNITSFNKSNRFQDNDGRKKLPGPGHYTNQSNDTVNWYQRTFNLRYLQNGNDIIRSKSSVNQSTIQQ